MTAAAFLPPSANILRSPKQAAKTFSQVGGLPRQRNVFVVNFVPNGLLGNSLVNLTNLTVAAKSVDRPKINPKTEELHQYNKKRQIYTGFKLEPIRMQFYDSQDGAAQDMWTHYSRYYFGDFKAQQSQQGSTSNSSSYGYDATNKSFNDFKNTGFGLVVPPTGDPNSMYFFDRIEIYHFYDGLYDLYSLVHPKISSFEPDDLDYSSSEVALITMSVSYENLQYYRKNSVASASVISDIFNGSFNGDPLVVADSAFPIASSNTSLLTELFPSNPALGSLLAGNLSAVASIAAAYRFFSGGSGSGSLSNFGNFQFGASAPYYNNTPLGVMSLGNPALAAALRIGSGANPLAAATPVLANALAAASRGVNGALYEASNAAFQAATSVYGNASALVGSALMASAATNPNGNVMVNASGQVTLPPTGYGMVNAQMTGTAQYGFNPNTDSGGNSWGSSGPGGFTGPVGQQNPGPYNSGQPAGIDGRFVQQEPLPAPPPPPPDIPPPAPQTSDDIAAAILDGVNSSSGGTSGGSNSTTSGTWVDDGSS